MTIKLNPYKPGESDLYLELVTDLRVMKYITERELAPIEGEAEFAEILAYNQEHQDGSGYFKVLKDEVYLGFAKISWSKNAELEVGYMLVPEFWGMGYGQKILKNLLTIATESKSLNQSNVFAVIDPKNGASKHLLQKFGFVSTWLGVEDGLPTEYLHYHKEK